MKGNLDRVMNILIGSFVGVFIGSTLFKYLDYLRYPDLYALRSAPWYAGVLVTGLVMAGFILICVIVKLVIRKKA